MNDDLEYHQRLIGRVIVFLIGKGLRRVDFEPGDALSTMEETRGDEEDAIDTFFDILHWMKDNGLINVQSIQAADFGEFFNGVQLTEKALQGIRTPQETLGGETIEVTARKESLSGETYGKIGEALGGFVAGALKGFAGG